MSRRPSSLTSAERMGLLALALIMGVILLVLAWRRPAPAVAAQTADSVQIAADTIPARTTSAHRKRKARQPKTPTPPPPSRRPLDEPF